MGEDRAPWVGCVLIPPGLMAWGGKSDGKGGVRRRGHKERWNVYHYPTTIIYIISIAIEVVVVVAADVAEEVVVVVVVCRDHCL